MSDRGRSNNWRFADSGSRFDANPRAAIRDREPISSTFTRKIMRCRRCGSRVVSNARRCPYCGKSLAPFYQSVVFWSMLVGCLALAWVYSIFFYHPDTKPSENPHSYPPVAIGLPDRTEPTQVPIGTTIDSNNLLVTVISVNRPYATSDGLLIYEVTVQIVNRSQTEQRLLTTQWIMRRADGSYVECYTGQTDSGITLSSGVEGRQLKPNEIITAKIYFAVESPHRVVYLVNPLETQSNPEISWILFPDTATPVEDEQ